MGDWQNCHFTAAGSRAYVFDWGDSLIQGFDLYTSLQDDASPGPWFMIDYVALEPGDPNIAIYDYRYSWDDPNEFIYLRQVPSPDFNTDGIVNLLDFSYLSAYWMQNDCNSLGDCMGTDLDGDGIVDLNDLLAFTDYWLWSSPQQSDDSGQLPHPDPDPNLIYRLVDVQGMDEISLAVGQSITLYAEMQSFDIKDVWLFNIETIISDPNLGTIDNIAYDPNNPPGLGSARILAEPNRWAMFDRWGPGYQQPEGIQMSGLSFSGAFADGPLASFVYTAQMPGDVILTLINWDTTSTSGEKLYPVRKSIRIHQQEPFISEMTTMSILSTETSTVQQESIPTLTQEEMIQMLDEIWESDPAIQDTIDPKEWKEFMKSVEQTY